MLLHAGTQRRQRRIEADMAEAVAMGYSGCRAKDGPQALQRFVERLRGQSAVAPPVGTE